MTIRAQWTNEAGLTDIAEMRDGYANATGDASGKFKDFTATNRANIAHGSYDFEAFTVTVPTSAKLITAWIERVTNNYYQPVWHMNNNSPATGTVWKFALFCPNYLTDGTVGVSAGAYRIHVIVRLP